MRADAKDKASETATAATKGATPDTRHPAPDTLNLKPETRNLKTKTQDPRPSSAKIDVQIGEAFCVRFTERSRFSYL